MGQFILPAMIAATVATTAATVAASRKSTGAQQVELDLQKRQESSAAKDRELQRKRRLSAILGSQAAEAAAKGLQMSGSVANISITDAKRAAEDSAIDRSNTRLRINALSRQRSSLSKIGKYRTAATIMGGAERFVARGSVPGGGAQPEKSGGNKKGGTGGRKPGRSS